MRFLPAIALFFLFLNFNPVTAQEGQTTDSGIAVLSSITGTMHLAILDPHLDREDLGTITRQLQTASADALDIAFETIEDEEQAHYWANLSEELENLTQSINGRNRLTRRRTILRLILLLEEHEVLCRTIERFDQRIQLHWNRFPHGRP